MFGFPGMDPQDPPKSRFDECLSLIKTQIESEPKTAIEYLTRMLKEMKIKILESEVGLLKQVQGKNETDQQWEEYQSLHRQQLKNWKSLDEDIAKAISILSIQQISNESKSNTTT